MRLANLPPAPINPALMVLLLGIISHTIPAAADGLFTVLFKAVIHVHHFSTSYSAIPQLNSFDFSP